MELTYTYRGEVRPYMGVYLTMTGELVAGGFYTYEQADEWGDKHMCFEYEVRPENNPGFGAPFTYIWKDGVRTWEAEYVQDTVRYPQDRSSYMTRCWREGVRQGGEYVGCIERRYGGVEHSMLQIATY